MWGAFMNKSDLIKEQMENIRKDLNNKILNDINNDIKDNRDTLLISCKLDKLITDYMNLDGKIIITHKEGLKQDKKEYDSLEDFNC